jgi:hypothetical protein
VSFDHPPAGVHDLRCLFGMKDMDLRDASLRYVTGGPTLLCGTWRSLRSLRELRLWLVDVAWRSWAEGPTETLLML